MNCSDSSTCKSDESLVELLTLNREVDSMGTIIYRNSEGKPHRIHGPAVLCPDGTEFWYQNGQLHREDGPALVDPRGEKHWYLHDRIMPYKQWAAQVRGQRG